MADEGPDKPNSSAEAPTELVESSKEEGPFSPVEEPKISAHESEENADASEAVAAVEEAHVEEEAEKNPHGSIDRDAVLARVATEKRLSFIRAWEESEKCKAENKAQKRVSAIGVWENSKKATLEAELKKIEEQLEKKKADYIEKVKNQMALIHKAAEEKRAVIEAQRGVDMLKAEETAAKHRATGSAPKKLLGCF